MVFVQVWVALAVERELAAFDVPESAFGTLNDDLARLLLQLRESPWLPDRRCEPHAGEPAALLLTGPMRGSWTLCCGAFHDGNGS